MFAFMFLHVNLYNNTTTFSNRFCPVTIFVVYAALFVCLLGHWCFWYCIYLRCSALNLFCRFSALLRDKPLRTSWEKKMEVKREKQLVKQYQQQLKDEQARGKEASLCLKPASFYCIVSNNTYTSYRDKLQVSYAHRGCVYFTFDQIFNKMFNFWETW